MDKQTVQTLIRMTDLLEEFLFDKPDELQIAAAKNIVRQLGEILEGELFKIWEIEEQEILKKIPEDLLKEILEEIALDSP